MSPDERRYINWCAGSYKRISDYTGHLFLTQKDRRIHDKQFKFPRVHVRRSHKARRAKPL